jgi:HD superfamily phosphodiesterase
MKVPLLSTLFNYVLLTTRKYDIDESHGISHSMNILRYANAIFEEELKWSPNPDVLKAKEPVIYTAAVVHDMCDKKYRVEEEGLQEIERLLEPVSKLSRDDRKAVLDIVSTMSYSKVQKVGFPSLDTYQTAYHIVREADLLTAYDFDRSMIYHMTTGNKTMNEAFLNAKDLFYDRVLRHNEDGLFFTRYAQRHSNTLHNRALMRMLYWGKMVGRVG